MAWSRRQFGKALGAAALVAPFLATQERAVAQAGSKRAKRLILFFSPNGTIPHLLGTQGSGAGYSFAAGSIMEPLKDHREDIAVIRGLDFKDSTNHEAGMKAMITGNGTDSSPGQGKSIDQHIAGKLAGETRFDSLELGVQTSAWGTNTQTRMSYSGAGKFVSPDDDPRGVYRRLFGAVTGEPMEADRALLRRSCILDLAKGELGQLQRKVGAEERQKLEQHLESIRTVERRLQGPAGNMGGGSCESPAPVMALNTQDNDSFPAIGQAQLDLMLTALACDATRIASIQWSHTVGPVVFSWLGASDNHHNLSHYDRNNPQGMQQYVDCERWYATRFAALLDGLKARPEPGGQGTMFDHSLVVWVKELGDGRNHVCTDVPWVFAGGAGGALKRGQLLDVAGAPHQKALVSICKMMGLDDQLFGDPAHGAGPLPGLLA
jgi:hypothetical protein